jgi:hypothetical protein
MQPVVIFQLPHNYRDSLYEPGQAPSIFCDDPRDDLRSPFGNNFVDLPIKMPSCLIIHTDRDGRPIAAWANGARIRWRDLDTVVEGVRQFNVHCAQMGVTVRPRSPPPDDDAGPDEAA